MFGGPCDTRSKDQKLEAVIDPKSGATEGERRNAEHLLFKRRAKRPERTPGFDIDAQRRDRRKGPFHDAPDLRAAARAARGHSTYEGPYAEYRGGRRSTDPKEHALGMRHGRNAHGGHVIFHGPPPPGFHDEGSADD